MQIGRRAKTQVAGLMELLLECHGRIRTFVELAARLSASEGLDSAEVADAAMRVRRYFGEALPLHVEDEEQSLLPRLEGHDDGLDAALQRMHREHDEHLPSIERLVSLCAELESAPERLALLRSELGATSSLLGQGLRAHLAHEEELILPAIDRWLAADEQAAVVRELRARRATGG